MTDETCPASSYLIELSENYITTSSDWPNYKRKFSYCKDMNISSGSLLGDWLNVSKPEKCSGILVHKPTLKEFTLKQYLGQLHKNIVYKDICNIVYGLKKSGNN